MSLGTWRASTTASCLLAFDTFFPSPSLVVAKQGLRDLEGETKDPRTGNTLRMFDTRRFDLVEQRQTSFNEVEEISPASEVLRVHRWEFTTRYVYREEMALLLRVAGFGRWQILGGFDRRPLTQEIDSMVVLAWP